MKSTQTALDGARSGSHTATVSLPDGTYTIKYNSQDLAGNISKTRTFVVTLHWCPPGAGGPPGVLWGWAALAPNR